MTLPGARKEEGWVLAQGSEAAEREQVAKRPEPALLVPGTGDLAGLLGRGQGTLWRDCSHIPTVLQGSGIQSTAMAGCAGGSGLHPQAQPGPGTHGAQRDWWAHLIPQQPCRSPCSAGKLRPG